MAQLVNGTVDAATGSETQALLNSALEPNIRIVLTLSECRYRLIARRSAGIRRIADLRGKKIATTMNTSAQFYLAGMLRSARLEESGVKLIPLEGSEMPSALATGSVDAVSIWEPHAQNSLEALANDAVVLEDASIYKEQFNLNTRADLLRDRAKRLVLVSFIQAIIRASARIRNRPVELVPSLASRIGMNERTVLAVWQRFKFPASIPSELRTALIKVEPWAAAIQKREPRTRQDLESLIDSSLLAQAR